jgi:precorrin-8X/cobalt-precorrin-8 methylmutase
VIGGYLSDPAEIYAQSFAAIRAEADLSGIPPELEDVVVRMIHACGMPDIVQDLRWGGDLAAEVGFGLGDASPVFCDCEAVRAGISRKHLLPFTDLVVTLNDPAVPALADERRTTRSAAAVDLWRPAINDSVVVIGNAPTALFRLLDLIDETGNDRPAAIIATPVGFIGAAESKARLALDRHKIPFLTLLGRRGGSAIASAAFNAIAKKLWP